MDGALAQVCGFSFQQDTVEIQMLKWILGLVLPLGVQTREEDDCRCKGAPKGTGVKLLYSFIAFAHQYTINMILKSFYTQQRYND